MIFNFTKDHQFTSKISLKNEKLETVNQTKLLGVIITNDLKWQENTKYIVRKANKKMRMLHKFSKFTKNKSQGTRYQGYQEALKGELRISNSIPLSL